MSWRFLMSSGRFERLAVKAFRNESSFISLNKRDLKKLEWYQRTPAVSDALEKFNLWCSKPPKGFEKFFKEKPGAGSKPAASEQPKETSRAQPKPKEKKDMPDFFKLGSRTGGGGSGGGGGFGQMPDAEKQKIASMVGLGLVGVLGLIFMNQMKYR